MNIFCLFKKNASSLTYSKLEKWLDNEMEI